MGSFDKSQHVGNLGRGLKHAFIDITKSAITSARWKPRKGIETYYQDCSGFPRLPQHVGNLGRGLKHLRALVEYTSPRLSTLETSEGD